MVGVGACIPQLKVRVLTRLHLLEGPEWALPCVLQVRSGKSLGCTGLVVCSIPASPQHALLLWVETVSS